MSTKCACLRNDFNLYVTHSDCRYMIIEDQSDWMSEEGYSKPDTLPVKITNLETGQSMKVDVYTSSRTRISFSNFFGNCIPDGLYCFECVNCGISYKINRPYLCNVQCKVDELLAKARTQDQLNEVSKLQLMIDTIIIDTRIGKLEKATETFSLLNKRLNHLTCPSCRCE